jgi:hypothetical protein
MAEFRHDPYPEAAGDMTDIRDRIRLWDTEGILISDVPVVVGQVANPSEFAIEQGGFRTVAGGSVRLDTDGAIDQYESYCSGKNALPEEEARALVDPLFRTVNSDAQGFLRTPPDAEQGVALTFDLMTGMYIASDASDPHIDPIFGLGYFASLGPSPVFLPGRFTKQEVQAIGRDDTERQQLSFASGAIIRANETNLHRAPRVSAPVPRMLARIVIKNVRNY